MWKYPHYEFYNKLQLVWHYKNIKPIYMCICRSKSWKHSKTLRVQEASTTPRVEIKTILTTLMKSNTQ